MTTPSNNDVWIEEALEQHASHFNNGKPYITEPKLTELAAEIRRRIDMHDRELATKIATVLAEYIPEETLLKLIQELNQRGGNNG
jgi:hypothetical protein